MGLHLVIHDSIRRDKEAGSGDVIQNQENAGGHQHRECGQTHDRCDKPSPGAERQAPQTHAARAHVERGETKKDDISTRKATKVTQNDIMLKWGKGMSSAPTWIGRK